MASRIAGIPICMLSCDQHEVDLAKALVHLEVDLRLVGFPRKVSFRRHCILQMQRMQWLAAAVS